MARKTFFATLSALLLIVQLAAIAPARAHPVSFQGATSVMTWNQPDLSDTWVTYSARPYLALAGRYMRMVMPEGESRVYLPQVDVLLKRWNAKEYQANIYAYGGFGGARFQSRDGTAAIAGFELDAESRKYFVMGKAEAMRGSIGPDFDQFQLRLGIAPYEAEFEELASWLMVQAQYNPALTTKYAITPLARFFYKSVLWETGVSLDGDWMLNVMFHF